MLRRKLFLNLAILLLCGSVALSIPVLVNHWKQPANASDQNDCGLTLVSEFSGTGSAHATDACVAWRLCLQRGASVVTTWDEIYADYLHGGTLSYDQKHLKITAYGLCYRDIHTAEDYQKLFASQYCSYVIYQGQTCLLQLP
ncbi:MAG: hypothetical protein NC133_01395 [Prevotella sp.]|nr:hypothetical protein [Prevotella sp.]